MHSVVVSTYHLIDDKGMCQWVRSTNIPEAKNAHEYRDVSERIGSSCSLPTPLRSLIMRIKRSVTQSRDLRRHGHVQAMIKYCMGFVTGDCGPTLPCVVLQCPHRCLSASHGTVEQPVDTILLTYFRHLTFLTFPFYGHRRASSRRFLQSRIHSTGVFTLYI